MKIRRSIFWLAAIVAVFIALVFWFETEKPAETPLIASTETNVAPPATAKPIPLINKPVLTNAPMAAATASTPKAASGGKLERIQGLLSTYNDVPIDFYGKLEDQFGNPVVGAKITNSIRVNNGQRGGTDHFSTTSDANGLFEFHGRGQDIGMMPRKEGYALASPETFFKYSRLEDHQYVSDANNPTVIKMWKLQGAEPLVSINQHYKLHYTDAPMNFDFLAGTIVPTGGDIRITVNRPAGMISTRNQQDWGLTIEAVNGGLIETSMAESRVTYVAPDNGYQPSATFMMSTTDNTWYEAIHQMFFLNSRNGQVYSKVNLSFRLNENPDGFMNITLSGVANTNSSRSWEGDPNTMAAVAQ